MPYRILISTWTKQWRLVCDACGSSTAKGADGYGPLYTSY